MICFRPGDFWWKRTSIYPSWFFWDWRVRERASVRHALATAKICNEIQPRYLAALTVTPCAGNCSVSSGTERRISAARSFETLAEMKQIFEKYHHDNLKFVGTHASNYLPVTGTLQKDKQKMIAQVDKVLSVRDERLLRPDYQRGL